MHSPIVQEALECLELNEWFLEQKEYWVTSGLRPGSLWVLHFAANSFVFHRDGASFKTNLVRPSWYKILKFTYVISDITHDSVNGAIRTVGI